MTARPAKLELMPLPEELAAAAQRSEPARSEALGPDVLGERFRRTMAERRRHVQELWNAVLRNFDDRAARGRLARTAQTLGSAAIAYGFERVGECAGELAQQLLAHPAQALREAPPALDALLAAMLDASRTNANDSSWRSSGAPSVWLGPAGAEPLPWLQSLLAVGGYAVRSLEQMGEARTPAASHLVIVALDAVPQGMQWLAQRLTELRADGTPVHVIALSEGRGYAERVALATLGVDLVLPARPDPSLLLRVVEGELASRSGRAPTAVLLMPNGAARREWSDAFAVNNLRLRFAATRDELVRLTDEHAADAVVLGPAEVEGCVELARVVRQDEQNIQLPIIALDDGGASPAALLAAGIEGVPSTMLPADVAIIVHDRVARRRRRVLGSRRDALTGLLTRVAFAHAMKTLLESDSPWVVFAIVDLDDFKGINERLGHVGGDRVLRDTAQRIATALPPTGVAGRFGGDEFVVGFGARSDLEARWLLAHIAQIGNGLTLDPERARFSVGALMLDRGDRRGDVALDSLTARADALLYRSKAAGKATLSVVSWKESGKLLA